MDWAGRTVEGDRPYKGRANRGCGRATASRPYRGSTGVERVGVAGGMTPPLREDIVQGDDGQGDVVQGDDGQGDVGFDYSDIITITVLRSRYYGAAISNDIRAYS